MSIMELGALGELVGAIAVVATLIYLAVQIRQTTAIVSASTTADHHSMMVTIRMKLAENPELTELFHRGVDDPGNLAVNERNRFDQLLAALIHASEQAFEFHRLGVVGGDLWNEQKSHLEWIVGTPGFQEYWNESKHFKAEEFRSEIQKLIDEAVDA